MPRVFTIAPHSGFTCPSAPDLWPGPLCRPSGDGADAGPLPSGRGASGIRTGAGRLGGARSRPVERGLSRHAAVEPTKRGPALARGIIAQHARRRSDGCGLAHASDPVGVARVVVEIAQHGRTTRNMGGPDEMPARRRAGLSEGSARACFARRVRQQASIDFQVDL